MTLIEWKEDFSVGIPGVDFEHQVLIELINTLHENMSADDSTYGVPEFLDEICVHMVGHFSHEEEIMQERKYDQLVDHTQSHKKLLDQMHATIDAYKESACFNDREFAENLQQWFTEHFKKHDIRLHEFLE